ncbi:serine/threonine-protein kinase [Xanthomonas euvesicatoria pv. eucalypti]|uniref:serine/threonine protein kinase n=1 Tax=Xanthomonas euvesicatoria TaxID=456327 RepID=UPI0026E3E076|nr:serine/threonine-protein kinase [Xanthomonas euvesicatoria]MDO7932233.1 serine/threonine-protein kinase [Xanthomonas euvesicatoria pv. eucalypti]MDO7938054.1 serine/threonine-protein kinase [Xanthomonas euvesicatoria pv. eucalypti]MDO7940601.1 serine/threonine-protein kinase [Xanthomonas euvesicatoria pv. eucalypti]MDO7955472.1 serine/threonine-protein kinase [Xanthomonas euvesicatoria pv. eucalypti]MDO7959100.1 serine/threonine-protein kinase [Xanthomonas euvesicatoria pv. eucalypti]
MTTLSSTMKQISGNFTLPSTALRADAERDAPETAQAPEPHTPPHPVADHPLNLLEKRRSITGVLADERKRLEVVVPRLQAALAPHTWSSSSSDSPTTPLTGRSPRLGPQPGSPTWACLLDTPARLSALAGADSSDAFQNLRNARRLVSDTRHARQHVVLSPRLVKSLTSRSERPDLIQKLSALKPGALDVDNGFVHVTLETGHAGTAGTLDAMPTVGTGASASTYAVRLAEDLWQGGQNCGRDFIFKALLRTDPQRPIPPTLCDPATVADAPTLQERIAERRAMIFQEYQMIRSVDAVPYIVHAHGVVQIEHTFGILLEKIDGISVRSMIGRARTALQQGAISAMEYLGLARQLMADVLVSIACCEDAGIVHQDISHNNVMYDQPTKIFRLIDMGLGSEEGDPNRGGTPGFYDLSTPARHTRDVYSVAQLLVHVLKRPDYNMGMIGINRPKTADTFPFMDALQALPADHKRTVVGFFNSMLDDGTGERTKAERLLRAPFFTEPPLPPRDRMHRTFEKLKRLPSF